MKKHRYPFKKKLLLFVFSSCFFSVFSAVSASNPSWRNTDDSFINTIERDTFLYLGPNAPASPTLPSSHDPNILVLPTTQGLPQSRPQGTVINTISLGDFIIDERQLLYKTQIVDAEFIDAPVLEVLRGLAEASDINYVLPDIDSQKISTRIRMPAFKALEMIARDSGLEITKQDDLWFIRPEDTAQLTASTYKLYNIHLGKSGGIRGEKTFGPAKIGETSIVSFNTSTTANTTTSNNTTTTTTGNSTDGTDTTTGSLLSPLSNRFSEGSIVLNTISEILGITPPDSVNKEKEKQQKEGESFMSYNEDSNTLYIITTQRKHQWIAKYLNTVDKAVSNIAIDAMFIESDINPNEAFGSNWSSVAQGFTIQTADDTLSYGAFDNFSFPTGALIESDNLSVILRAWIQETESRVVRYPRVVTANNKEVKIQTTTNIPIITNARTTGLTNTEDAVGGDTTQTDFTSGTQEIGTIITIIPQQLNDMDINLKIGIEISSEDTTNEDENGTTNGENLTGRITTASTVYEGEVKVPTGKTLAIGGLERISENSNIRRIPWVSEIPLFGFLFKDKEKDFRRTNITLLITPTILPNPEDGTLVHEDPWVQSRDERLFQDLNTVEKRAFQEDKKDSRP